jgi:hypothetical protein
MSQRVEQVASHLAAPQPGNLPPSLVVKDGVATITLSAPAKRNPLSYNTLVTLEQHLKSINPRWEYTGEDWFGLSEMPEVPSQSDLDRQGDMGQKLVKLGVNVDIGCVVIRAEGPIFSSGHDLKVRRV